MTAPEFRAGINRVVSFRVRARMGAARVPAALVTARVLDVRVRTLLPPPATMELAKTLRPVTLRVPLTAAVEALVRARRNVLFATRVGPPGNRKLSFRVRVPLTAPLAPVATWKPISTVLTSAV